jgi:hypothetical protein
MPNAMFDGDAFPGVFCIEDIRCSRREGGGYGCRATLYHDRASISVAFGIVQRDPESMRGRFVSVEWLPEAIVRSRSGERRWPLRARPYRQRIQPVPERATQLVCGQASDRMCTRPVGILVAAIA